jgi:hypothetical protein
LARQSAYYGYEPNAEAALSLLREQLDRAEAREIGRQEAEPSLEARCAIWAWSSLSARMLPAWSEPSPEAFIRSLCIPDSDSKKSFPESTRSR